MRIAVAICALVAFANALVGPSGVVKPDGQNVQFTHKFAKDIAPGLTAEQARNVVLIGPSGSVSADGKNIQFRQKRALTPEGDLIGDSGAILADGQQIQFTEGGVSVLLRGPSGLVLSNGQLVQLKSRKKRALGHNVHGDIIGDTGAIFADGQQVNFGAAATVLLRGPSGVVLSNGKLVQLKSRKKRALGINAHGDIIGDTGAIFADGQQVNFGGVATVVARGPSGIVLSNGKNIQLKSRKKRALGHNAHGDIIGDTGAIFADGQQVNFGGAASVLLRGPSGIVLSNGKLIQLKNA